MPIPDNPDITCYYEDCKIQIDALFNKYCGFGNVPFSACIQPLGQRDDGQTFFARFILPRIINFYLMGVTAHITSEKYQFLI
jgi:hypothetical protein